MLCLLLFASSLWPPEYVPCPAPTASYLVNYLQTDCLTQLWAKVHGLQIDVLADGDMVKHALGLPKPQYLRLWYLFRPEGPVLLGAPRLSSAAAGDIR